MIMRSDERLKVQLMGKDWVKRKRREVGKAMLGGAGGKRPVLRHTEAEISSDDEVGRTSLGKAKTRVVELKSSEHAGMDDGSRSQTCFNICAKVSRPSRKAKASNYLDEILAEKARKEQKRARKKQRYLSTEDP